VDSMQPIGDGGCEADAGKEVAGFLVVSGRDRPPVLQPALAMDLGSAHKDVSVVINYGLDRVRFIKRVSGFG
jgi:hypothetical protein